MRGASLLLLFLPAGLLAQGQYDLDPLPPYPDHVQYTHYSDQIDNPDYYDYPEMTPRPPEEQFQFQSQQQVQQEVIPAPTLEPGTVETEPTEPGPLGPASSVSTRPASTASAAYMSSIRRSASGPSAPTRSSCGLTCAVTSSPSAACWPAAACASLWRLLVPGAVGAARGSWSPASLGPPGSA
ncbi:PREDICTED: microfibrillar-associated protein 2 isoform X3 [Capra hircus]|uniref:microfibrillar-associated protein 2 isoform X3 n=1 Tax=Capra hircus TaxID=9925 RepID=UPI000847A2DD|nr:PREDICTED: microfibrillar-associated protein 2 isoform X3 [Capra hircus]